MKRFVVIACWICIIVAGGFLRFDDLGKRPFHSDEATGARITARKMESGGTEFDPKHYHGPLLGDLAILLCARNGEGGWNEMSKTTLRTLPAIVGTLLLLVPLLWRKRLGDAPVLLAAAMLATSPLLVYYSRMFIHEILLVMFGLLVLTAITRRPRWGIAGILTGLMFGTKESFAISVVAWTGAGCMIALGQWKSWNRSKLLKAWADYWKPATTCILTAAFTSALIYTDGFQHPKGAIDAVRTFFVYETVAGHDKPFGYYFQLLAMPSKSAGYWWFGTPVTIMALVAFAGSFLKSCEQGRYTIRFIGYAALGHLLIYSIIAYKTPWLACLPWAHVCLLAGFSLVGFTERPWPSKVALIALAVLSLITQTRQSRNATGRLASDDRNPFAYVPTRNDVENLGPWLKELAKVAPDKTLEPVAVTGVDYWPLPWYLRDFEQIGYWKEPGPGLLTLPLVFALPDVSDATAGVLAETHMPLPRGLRSGVPLYLFVRNDIWKKWMETEKP